MCLTTTQPQWDDGKALVVVVVHVHVWRPALVIVDDWV